MGPNNRELPIQEQVACQSAFTQAQRNLRSRSKNFACEEKARRVFCGVSRWTKKLAFFFSLQSGRRRPDPGWLRALPGVHGSISHMWDRLLAPDRERPDFPEMKLESCRRKAASSNFQHARRIRESRHRTHCWLRMQSCSHDSTIVWASRSPMWISWRVQYGCAKPKVRKLS